MKKTLKKIRTIIQNLIEYIPPEAKKLLPFIGIVALAFVLIIVIMIAQSCGRKSEAVPETSEFVFEDVIEDETLSGLATSDEDEAEAEQGEDEEENEAETEEETEAPTEPETEADYGNLTRNGDPELLSVMQRYFSARANADLDAINELYGITDESAEERAENQSVLEFNARYVSSFDNITTYVMDGPYSNTWLVYTTTDVNFYTCSTKAPTIMWCFIEKDADDEYIILDSHGLSQEFYEYAEAENHTPEVRALAADVNDRLREALESDPELEETYGILRYGSPLWEDTAEAETSVAIVEEESGEETAEDAEEISVSEDETPLEGAEASENEEGYAAEGEAAEVEGAEGEGAEGAGEGTAEEDAGTGDVQSGAEGEGGAAA